jgi:hypothetical protein
VTGNLREGWKEYEWRRQCPDAVAPRAFSRPQWRGEAIDGKTILIFPEQGLGDAIHFVRYVPMAAERGAKVVLECAPPLERIFRQVWGIEKLIVAGQALPAFDLQCAMPSLPGAFETDIDSIPAATAYLSADEETVRRWREKVGHANGIRQVGIAWAGSTANRNDRNRSIPLQKWRPILGAANCRFHSLQLAPPSAGFAVTDWSGELRDFAETAGLIANLDLVITVDTSVAHLAGAMGKPVWLMIPFPPDWRWMLERTDSLWYPTVKLFRQKRAGDWEEVIADVAAALGAGA